MKQLVITIIVPIYNIERYLRECVDSILMQSYDSLEVILVDDGSTDDSAAICDKYAAHDPRVRVIHKKNGGLSDARNAGLERATGDYVLFVDGDDYLCRADAIERGVRAVEANPEIDTLLFNYASISSTKTVQREGIDTSRVNDHPKCEALDYLISSDKLTVTAWSKFVRRELLVRNNITFKRGLLSEDYDWNFKILIHSKTLWSIDDCLYHYRLREGSITNSLSTKHLLDIWSIVKEWSEKIPREVADPREAELYLDFVAFIYGVLLSRLHLASPRAVRKSLTGEMREYQHLLCRSRSAKLRRLYWLYRVLGFELTWRVVGVAMKILR